LKLQTIALLLAVEKRGGHSLYEKDWAEYRKIRNSAFWIWVLGVPAIFVLIFPVSLILPKLTFILMTVLAISWMAGFLYYALRFQTFSCPQCGEMFSSKGFYNLSFLARKCVHCGLKKFSTQP
jgi:hypothetical protein